MIAQGPKNSIADIPGILVGNSSDAAIKTGVTVVTGDKPFTAGVSVLGGAPGTRETDLLSPDRLVQQVDAVVLSGGSAFGLDAASGVADMLAEQGRGLEVGTARVPIVPGAILFDLLNGGDKGWQANPYNSLGRLALAAASPEFEIGTAGAGTGATTLDLKGGLGSASAVLPGGVVIGALAAVNSAGTVIRGGGPEFWAAPFEIDGEFGGIPPQGGSDPCWMPEFDISVSAPGRNTTIAVVATNAALDQSQATALATTAHGGLARSILPSHTILDGDLVFAVSTGEKRIGSDPAALVALGHAAAGALARAVARGVHTAVAEPHDTRPSWQALHG